MQDILFPVTFRFRISSISNDFSATDANGKKIAYVRQKMFKFKEEILVYNDESKSKVNYKIRADRWLDFSAAYAIFDENDQEIGKVTRQGWQSLWKANYTIIDQFGNVQYDINEENAWVKVLDSLLGQIPILNIFTGYLFNPSYIVTNMNNHSIVRIKKLPSFFGRNFELTKEGEMDADDDDRIMLSLMMMVLLERRRG